MSNLTVAAVALAAAASAASLTLAACGESEGADAVATTRTPPAEERPRGVVVDCSSRSGASFSGVYSGSDNVVVGPLALVGGAYTPPESVREFGGDKIFALVRPGHRVTVALSQRTKRVAALGYGPLPEGKELTPRDGHRSVTFVSCAPGEPSGSTADGEPVTFWSGFVLASLPACVPIAVWVDDEPSPRHAVLRMGVPRCP